MIESDVNYDCNEIQWHYHYYKWPSLSVKDIWCKINLIIWTKKLTYLFQGIYISFTLRLNLKTQWIQRHIIEEKLQTDDLIISL